MRTIDEGVIKFEAVNESACLPCSENLQTLIELRQILWEYGLIGVADGIGYGNVSLRLAGGFLITGSQTGSLEHLSEEHLAFVTQWDVSQNKLWYHGKTPASSESLTHAALYEHNKDINCVIHGHHALIWHHGLDHLPTVDVKYAYGTPETAKQIAIQANKIGVKGVNTIIMAGHQDGFITYGTTVHHALEAVLLVLQQI
jgi:ribulose-5-phosphate 4-epimerase/fuculose-1-phosphate aldolase